MISTLGAFTSYYNIKDAVSDGFFLSLGGLLKVVADAGAGADAEFSDMGTVDLGSGFVYYLSYVLIVVMLIGRVAYLFSKIYAKWQDIQRKNEESKQDTERKNRESKHDTDRKNRESAHQIKMQEIEMGAIAEDIRDIQRINAKNLEKEFPDNATDFE